MEEQQDLIIEINYGKIKNGNTLKLDLCIPYIYIYFLVRSVLEASKEKPQAVVKKSVKFCK